MSNLFAEATLPVVSRYVDPGDSGRLPRHKRKRDGPAQPRERVDKSKPKFNPFRQPIGDPDELEFRHMHWQQLRDTVAQTLATTGTSPHAMARFANCGAECVIEWSEAEQRYRLRASYCRSRHCAPCMKAKAKLIAGNLREKLDQGTADEADRFRFVTLTLRHSAAPLKEQIDNLYHHFRLLRRSKLWRQSQKGGAVCFECKRNERGEWHPHLHIISEGGFIKQDRLANHWMSITKGSFRVDVRKIGSGKDAANYVAKYVGKGADASVWKDRDAAQEWVIATRGLRSCATFGTWRGFRLLAHDRAHDATDWVAVGLLSRVCAQARAGSIADNNLLWLLANALQYDPSRRSKRDATTGSVT